VGVPFGVFALLLIIGAIEDVARLSPLKDRHINFMGRYQFNFAASGPDEGLRPLRDPKAIELDDDDDGGEA
jgi:hypothetical protein